MTIKQQQRIISLISSNTTLKYVETPRTENDIDDAMKLASISILDFI
jgi:hypothetical protein